MMTSNMSRRSLLDATRAQISARVTLARIASVAAGVSHLEMAARCILPSIKRARPVDFGYLPIRAGGRRAAWRRKKLHSAQSAARF